MSQSNNSAERVGVLVLSPFFWVAIAPAAVYCFSMNMTFRSGLVVLLCLTGLSHAGDVQFNRDIRPLLSDRCFHCHGPGEGDRKKHLRLDVAEGDDGAYRTHKGRTAIVPKSLKKSELWSRITTSDPDDVMPPSDSHKKPLSAEEKALFKEWIEDGAEYQDFWAFVPPKRTPPKKKVRTRAWRKGIVDPYVMTRFRKKNMGPKDRADKRTLIRRVTFGLTGLPPSLEEIDAFLKDGSKDAYVTLVDRLLKQESYGEHMARYWADLVRLADTNGMHKDFPRDFSAYRSWLIRAFNDNLHFDDFIRYQLAGDLYADATEDQLVASGFNRLHLIIDRGTALPEESHHKNVLDRVEAFGTAFLGLTLQCAQCHDHKYDPISTTEFYQLYAFFNNFSGDPETRGRPKGGFQPPFIQLATGPVVEGEKPVVVQAMVMKEAQTPKDTFVLIRGAYDAPGEKVTRSTPAFLPPLKKKNGVYSRMDLAEWLVSDAQPLTARVTVNRFWQQLFGVGLVKTAEDFGAQGEWPSHPALLDELAVSFMESDWDVKNLIRELVLSNTYRQSSDATPAEYAADPENRLLVRGSRYRMDAEMIRDQFLFVSGKLNTTMYGPSVKPPQPAGLWKAVSMASPHTYVADTGDKIYRRSFYTYWRRGIPPPQMTLMNAPSRESCIARRERTNTPLQALLLMNEREYFSAAKATAQRTLKESDGDVTDGLIRVYEKITSQVPDKKRLALLQDALQEFQGLYLGDKKLLEELTPELAGTSDDERARTAGFIMVTHSLFNLEIAKVRR